jgi:hypothetical protein
MNREEATRIRYIMTTVEKILREHVTLEVECVDRLYLNGYIPPLATSGGLISPSGPAANRRRATGTQWRSVEKTFAAEAT